MEVNRDKDRNNCARSAIMYQAMNTPLEAAKIYLLMPKNVPISRSARFQWLLDHLNCVVTLTANIDISESSSRLEVISAVPMVSDNYLVHETSAGHYLVTSATELIFLAQTYRFVYCLDMSPSQSAVDITQGEILFDEIINCFRISLLGLCRQFTIPGNDVVFQPCLYLTVIVNTPFFISPAQQVLIKGVQVSSHNVQDIVTIVQGQFHHLEGRIAEVSAMAYEQMDQLLVKSKRTNTGPRTMFDANENECAANIPMVSPDANFVNMLRYSMLAISLLPENSLSNILVITDGVAAMPDSNIMESILYQLHYESISLSFLKVGSCFHWNSSAGYVSYTDLLLFLSHSTLGTYLDAFPVVKPEPTLCMNLYQELYLLWTYNCKDTTISPNLIVDSQKYKVDEFQPTRLPTLVSKRQTEENVNASMLLLISRRMREGYTVNEVSLINGVIVVKLRLHWKSFIYIHYIITTHWPIVSKSHLEVYIEAPYDFLHDITCLMRKETKSVYRQAVFERFWVRMTQLTAADGPLSKQLSAMQQTPTWCALPESVRNGIPVLVLNTSAPYDPSKLLLTASDSACQRFADIWMAICQVHTSNWRKWLHTHKLSLILRHDHPLPKHMHLANASGRFQIIQCRQAATSLYRLLGTWSSFVLIDNHTYLKLLYADAQFAHQVVSQQQSQSQEQQQQQQQPSPIWFCIVRVSNKLPCATLHLGFVSGTPGHVRYTVLADLRRQLHALSHVASGEEIRCCTIMRKPLEKILIKYERMPNDFHTVIFPDGTEPPYSMQSFPASPLAGTLFTTLSRYLFHQRWIWSATHPPNPRLGVPAISRILNTLTRMRLREGFKFAHSAAGIVTMVLEMGMVPSGTCVVQYVLFPPHSAWWGEDMSQRADGACGNDQSPNGALPLPSESDDDDDMDGGPDSDEVGDSELQMVTEVWIEPQYGCVKAVDSKTSYMNDKYYYELSELIRLTDLRCISSLLTLEHLSLMCQNKGSAVADEENVGPEIEIPMTRRPSRKRYTSTCRAETDSFGLEFERRHSETDNSTPWNPFLVQRIQHIAFKFDAIGMLPLCRQTELLFSMFIENKDHDMRTTLPTYTFTNAHHHLTPNQLLLDNVHRHLARLNDSELALAQTDCALFVAQLRTRNFLSAQTPCDANDGPAVTGGQWRCFIKGVSVTHVIMTFVPADVDGLSPVRRDLVHETVHGDPCSQPPCSTATAPTLPMYVLDCPLAMLVDSFVRPYTTRNDSTPAPGPDVDSSGHCVSAGMDVSVDHRYTAPCSAAELGARGPSGQRLDEVRSRARQSAAGTGHCDTTPTADETADYLTGKSAHQRQQPASAQNAPHRHAVDNTIAQQQHCRALVLTHSKCFALSLFAALHHRCHLHAADVQSAMNQCHETQCEIDISEYIRRVCGHVKYTDMVGIQELNQPTPCVELSPVHRLIKDKFLQMVNNNFSSIPSNRGFYYYSKNLTAQVDKVSTLPTTTLDTQCGDLDEEHSNATTTTTTTLASEESRPPAHNDGIIHAHHHLHPTSTNPTHAATTLASDSSADNLLLMDPLAAIDMCDDDCGMLRAAVAGGAVCGSSADGGLCMAIDADVTLQRISSCSDDELMRNISPLFLHFECTLRYESLNVIKAVKVIPTCLGELTQKLNGVISTINKSKIRVTLDLIFLTLPTDVQNVINDYSTKGMRSTSFCSDGFLPSTRSSASDASFPSEFKEPEFQFQVPDSQRRAISNLTSEIKWLLRDETVTALLDTVTHPVSPATLDAVMKHIEESVLRLGCTLEVVRLTFVCDPAESQARFADEFAQITLPGYRLCRRDELYYLIKASSESAFLDQEANTVGGREFADRRKGTSTVERDDCATPKQLQEEQCATVPLAEEAAFTAEDTLSQSDFSSPAESVLSTATGYDDDVSEDEDGFEWLVELSNKRTDLPNFWLILQLTTDAVRAYFHCRFLELSTNHVLSYTSVYRDILTAIRDLCKRVNQSLLLQQLYETRTCSNLLEPEESFNEIGSRNLSYTKLRSMQETEGDSNKKKSRHRHKDRGHKRMDKFIEGGVVRPVTRQIYSPTPNIKGKVSNATSIDPASTEGGSTPPTSLWSEYSFAPGHFACPVIWEVPFALHPRLKTGMGKNSLNIATAALKSVLDKFSVTDRPNMFVYRDLSSNVYYLRLQENIMSQTRTISSGGGMGCGVSFKGGSQKGSGCVHQIGTSDDPGSESPVSRSPSIASLPTGHRRPPMMHFESAVGANSSFEIRPRVRSVGEKESLSAKDSAAAEDSIVLKVHGITAVCDQIRCELVQVLQNRLDDAVLEFLSITLARNWRCPLTAEDVRFLQKPFREPEIYITMTLQDYVGWLLDPFYSYLKQNLLQFMNVPKYTDPRSEHYHFKDYGVNCGESTKQIPDENIFVYNQNQNPSTGQPSSGHHSIAVVAVRLVDRRQEVARQATAARFAPPTAADMGRVLPAGPDGYEDIVGTAIVSDTEEAATPWPDCHSNLYVQFRIWRQGRLNSYLLERNLIAAVQQAQWDLITEFYILRGALCHQSTTGSQWNKTEDELLGERAAACDGVEVITGEPFAHISQPNISGAIQNANDFCKEAFSCLEAVIPTPVGNVTTDESTDDLYTPLHVLNKDSTTLGPHDNQTSYLTGNKRAKTTSDSTDTQPSEIGDQHQPSDKRSRSEWGDLDGSRILAGSNVKERPPDLHKTPVTKDVQLTSEERGTEGRLTEVYSETVCNWFQFGTEVLNVPSIRKISVRLVRQKSFDVVVRELSKELEMLSNDTVRSFTIRNNTDDTEYEPSLRLCDDSYAAISSDCVLLIARNFELWKLTVDAIGTNQLPDGINTNYLHHVQYQRQISTLANHGVFAPRQKFLIAVLTPKEVIIYAYNWSKDHLDRLHELVTAQSLWLNARCALQDSGTAQKQGLFNHQAHSRATPHTVHNPYMSRLCDIESMEHFPRERIRKLQLINAAAVASTAQNNSGANTSAMLAFPAVQSSTSAHAQLQCAVESVCAEVTRAFRNQYDAQYAHDLQLDYATSFCCEMNALTKMLGFINDMNRLQTMYDKGEKLSTAEDLNLFHDSARVVHFCCTPMLFLSNWRLATAATRDQSLRLEEIVDKFRYDNDQWHYDLCISYITEIKGYLQTLGFQEISTMTTKFQHPNWSDIRTYLLYLQKTVMGGLVVFTVAMLKPFITTKLSAVECERLNDNFGKKTQYTLTFLDECEHIRDSMHLHSFTYDFHLRSVSNYISGGAGIQLYSGFHLTRFLDDFIKYYTKSPNYARNLAYSGEITVDELETDGGHLFNYLLSNYRHYGFQAVSMKEAHDVDTDYVLVRQTRVPHIIYLDSCDRQYTDHFDLTLIASQMVDRGTPGRDANAQRMGESNGHDSARRSGRFTKSGHCNHIGWDAAEGRHITLRYYIVLTAREDIYPKASGERKLGKFRTVSINSKRLGYDPACNDPVIASASAPSTFIPPVFVETKEPKVTFADGKSGLNLPCLTGLGLSTTQPSNLAPMMAEPSRFSSLFAEAEGPAIASLSIPATAHFSRIDIPVAKDLGGQNTRLDEDVQPPSEDAVISIPFPVTSHQLRAMDDVPSDMDEEPNISSASAPSTFIPPFGIANEPKVMVSEGMETAAGRNFLFVQQPPFSDIADIVQPLGVAKKRSGEVTSSDEEIEKLYNEQVVTSITLPTSYILQDYGSDVSILETNGDEGVSTVPSLSIICEPDKSDDCTIQPPKILTQQPEIQQECVNYLGYFSTHEQLMQNVMKDCIETCEKQLLDTTKRGTRDCRTHYLWDKLMSSDCCGLSFGEFVDLKARSHLRHMLDVEFAPRHNLEMLISQSAAWFVRFASTIVGTYVKLYRHYADEREQHWVLLHHRFDGACIVISVDMQDDHGDMYIMERKLNYPVSEPSLEDKQDMLQHFMEKFGYHIWNGMVNA